MKYRILLIIALAFLIVSCDNKQKAAMEQLRAENESLQNYKLNLEEEVNDYFATLFEVQEGIAKIKAAQDIIPVRPLGENSPNDVRNRVKDDIQFINNLIDTNREELENMREKLSQSSFRIKNLDKTLDMLTKQLNAESAKVIHLQNQLNRRDSIITEMGLAADAMGRNIEELTERNVEIGEIIQEQQETIHAGWYAVGNQKELKDNKIISSDGIFSSKKILQSDFNRNYFVKVDTREVRNIPLYTQSKPKIMTTHPKSSYSLEKESESFVLHISDPANFWSVSKYLVIEIN